MTWTWVCTLLLALALPQAGMAQRRGEQGSQAAELNVTLQVPIKFGDKIVPARMYRVSVSNDSLVLANPDTMEVQATVAAVIADLPEAAPAGRADLQLTGNDAQLVVVLGEHSYTAKGQKATAPTPRVVEADAPGAGKREVDVSNQDDTPQSPAAKVAKAVQRYLPGLNACIDGAQKAHWTTDDPRFANCVCPVALKWQMPHLDAPLRMHQKLVKGKFGMSFTVNPDGHISQCRVWAGARSPEMLEPAAAPAPAAPLAPSAPPAPPSGKP